LRSADLPIAKADMPEMPSTSSLKSAQSAYYQVGDYALWLALDNYMGQYFFTYYVLMAIGDNVEIWVQYDLSYPAGDPRDTPVITQAQIDQLLDQFDNNIYEKTTDYFGQPDFHSGAYSLLEAWDYVPPGYYHEETGRNVILVSNVRDESYYDPTYPSYIAGFYSPTFEAYFDRNIITIDTYNWEDRLEDYQATIAHEYQHLIHDDSVTGAVTWMNEASSLFAEPLCGYEIGTGQIQWFLATPDNSLTEWGDQGGINILADYGAAFLWALYITSNYDYYIMGDYVKNGVGGLKGLSPLLNTNGVTFEEAFHDWRLANLIHSDYPGFGKYNYHVDDFGWDFDLGELEPVKVHEVEGKKIEWTSAVDAFGTTYTHPYGDNPDGVPTTGPLTLGPFSTEYISFTDLTGNNLLHFNGDDETTIDPSWTDENGYWYSGTGDLINSLIKDEVYVDPADPTLILETAWDFEDYWDFGFVQVSEEGAWESEWISLVDNEGYATTLHDPSAHPDVLENLPGLTSYSPGVITLTYDLSAYAGETINVGFRIVTDWATHYYGWDIYSAEVSGTPLELEYVYPEAEFQVSVVERTELPSGFDFTFLHDMIFKCDASERGISFIHSMKWEDVILVVSPVSYYGTVDYEFKVTRLHGLFRFRGR
jgi:hypothetical protein